MIWLALIIFSLGCFIATQNINGKLSSILMGTGLTLFIVGLFK